MRDFFVTSSSMALSGIIYKRVGQTVLYSVLVRMG